MFEGLLLNATKVAQSVAKPDRAVSDVELSCNARAHYLVARRFPLRAFFKFLRAFEI